MRKLIIASCLLLALCVVAGAATRPVTPRANGEGSLGTNSYYWGRVYTRNITLGADLSAKTATFQSNVTFQGNLVGDNANDVTNFASIHVKTNLIAAGDLYIGDDVIIQDDMTTYGLIKATNSYFVDGYQDLVNSTTNKSGTYTQTVTVATYYLKPSRGQTQTLAAPPAVNAYVTLINASVGSQTNVIIPSGGAIEDGAITLGSNDVVRYRAKNASKWIIEYTRDN